MVVAAVRFVCSGAWCAAFPHPSNAYRPYLLRHPVLAFVNALVIAGTLGTILVISLTPELAHLSTITIPTIMRQTNAERTKALRPTLKESSPLARSAQLKGEHMLRHDYFDHTSPDGLSPWVWFERANYPYRYAGENLAIDFSEAEDVIAAWMRSPGHRKNLLADRYDETGIAVVTGEFQGRTATIVVQHFGARGSSPAAAGLPSSPALRVAGSAAPAALQLAAPEILEPADGALLATSRATVRGTAPKNSTVRILLDGKVVGTTKAENRAYAAAFPIPANSEREAQLTAIAIVGNATSPPSSPRRVQLDTKAPDVNPAFALMLPDPDGVPGVALLAVPTPLDALSASVTVPTRRSLRLTRSGDLFTARIPFPASPDVSFEFADAQRNARTIRLRNFLAYATSGAPSETPRAHAASSLQRTRPWLVGVLVTLAGLLGINILTHLRRHRLLHADVFAHALTVLALGIALILSA